MRYVCDSVWQWLADDVLVAGSPHRVFRLTAAGSQQARSVEAGEDVPMSPLVDRFVDSGAIHPAPLRRDEQPRSSVADVTVVTPQLGGAAREDDRITVDDGSQPPIAGATIRIDRNVGPAGARNAGRRPCTTAFVLFVDADVEIPELDPTHPDHQHWWNTLLRHLDDPRVGLVAPRVTGDDDSSLDLGDEPARIRAGSRVSYVPGATLLVRLEAFDAVGGFDESLRVGEDVDLIWRLDRAGWRCRYEPGVTVHHRPRDSWSERLRQQAKYGSSSGPLALRHPDALAPYVSGPWTAASWCMVAAGFPFAGPALGVGGAVRLATADPHIDRRAAFRLAALGHLAAGKQAVTAVRRAWWPLLVPFAWIRPVRRVLFIALVAPPGRVARDVAFSIGLWRSVFSARTALPLRPRIVWQPTGTRRADAAPPTAQRVG